MGFLRRITLKRSEMKTGNPKFYWDTAPLIAWIKNENRDDPADMDGLAEVIDLVERGKAILMISVLWRAEILSSTLNSEQKENLTKAFQNRYTQELSIDSRVMDLAREIRDFQRNQQRKDVLKNIRTPDAIHLASAVHYGASEFHTFDGKKTDGSSSSLLTLNGNVGGHRLKICVPKADQLRLNFSDGNEKQTTEDDDSDQD